MVVYDQSTFDRTIVIDEGLDDLPVLRVIFIMLIIIVGLALKFNEALVFWSIRLDAQNKSYRFVSCLYLFYTINSVLHIVQSVDSIARPVDYFEPKFMYQKYVVSTMELPFVFTLLIILMGKLFHLNYLVAAKSKYFYLV